MTAYNIQTSIAVKPLHYISKRMNLTCAQLKCLNTVLFWLNHGLVLKNIPNFEHLQNQQ